MHAYDSYMQCIDLCAIRDNLPFSWFHGFLLTLSTVMCVVVNLILSICGFSKLPLKVCCLNLVDQDRKSWYLLIKYRFVWKNKQTNLKILLQISCLHSVWVWILRELRNLLSWFSFFGSDLLSGLFITTLLVMYSAIFDNLQKFTFLELIQKRLSTLNSRITCTCTL